MSNILQLDHVSKTFTDTQNGGLITVLRDVSLSLEAGHSVAITGPSGCGKSTLLNIAGTLDTLTSGRVLLDDCDYAHATPNALATIRNRDIGFVFQLHHLLPQCSVLENILLPTLPNGCNNDLRKRATQLIERVGLQDRCHQRPATLSGGERQRVAVVRALINRPKVLLADEPTGSLDGESSEKLIDLLVDLNTEEQVALVLVTHAHSIAARMQQHFSLRNGSLTPTP